MLGEGIARLTKAPIRQVHFLPLGEIPVEILQEIVKDAWGVERLFLQAFWFERNELSRSLSAMTE